MQNNEANLPDEYQVPNAPQLVKELKEMFNAYIKIIKILEPWDWAKDNENTPEIIWESIKNNLPLPDDFNPKNFDKDDFNRMLEDHHKKVELFIENFDEFISFLEQARLEISAGLEVADYFKSNLTKYLSVDLKGRKKILSEFGYGETYYFYADELMQCLEGNIKNDLNN